MPKIRVKREPVVQPQDQSIRYIPLTQGKVAIVDAADYEWLSQWNWLAHYTRGGWYAKRAAPMHEEVLRLHGGIVGMADHVDGDSLNNRSGNLRLCTQAQNNYNRKKHGDSSSTFKGVTWNKPAKKWLAHIQIKGKKMHLGMFNDARVAALTYDAAAIELHGRFAKLNFPVIRTL